MSCEAIVALPSESVAERLQKAAEKLAFMTESIIAQDVENWEYEEIKCGFQAIMYDIEAELKEIARLCLELERAQPTTMFEKNGCQPR